ncbi:Factor arrest protein 10 [Phlyctema vagabunda]|uniref:Factor arrest protein 10 n=1 Tax=Phlyctema vagabunda TaxID=108571 RepID=A0ABR4PBI2_9HELO
MTSTPPSRVPYPCLPIGEAVTTLGGGWTTRTNNLMSQPSTSSPKAKITLRASTSGIVPAVRALTLDSDKPTMPVGRASKSLNKGLTAGEQNAWFDSPVMSRNHAKIAFDPVDKAVTLMDIGSMHGTFLNNRQLESHRAETFKNGDTVIFGAEVTRGVEVFPACAFTIEYELSQVSVKPSNTYSCPDSSDVEDEIDLTHDEEVDTERSQSREDPRVVKGPPAKASVSIESIDLTMSDFDTRSDLSFVEDDDAYAAFDADSDDDDDMSITDECLERAKASMPKSPAVTASDKYPATQPILIMSDDDSSCNSECMSENDDDSECASQHGDTMEEKDEGEEYQEEDNEVEEDSSLVAEIASRETEMINSGLEKQDRILAQHSNQLSELRSASEDQLGHNLKLQRDAIEDVDTQPVNCCPSEAPMQTGLRELLEASEAALETGVGETAHSQELNVQPLFEACSSEPELPIQRSSTKSTSDSLKGQECWPRWSTSTSLTGLHELSQTSSSNAISDQQKFSAISLPHELGNNNSTPEIRSNHAQDYRSPFRSRTETGYTSVYPIFSPLTENDSIYRRPSPSDAAMFKSATSHHDTPNVASDPAREESGHRIGLPISDRAHKEAFFQAREYNRARYLEMANFWDNSEFDRVESGGLFPKSASKSCVPRSRLSIHDIIEKSSTESKSTTLKRKAEEISSLTDEDLKGWGVFETVKPVVTNISDEIALDEASPNGSVKNSPEPIETSKQTANIDRPQFSTSNLPEGIYVGEPAIVTERPSKRLRTLVEKASYVVLGGAGLFSILVATAPDFL